MAAICYLTGEAGERTGLTVGWTGPVSELNGSKFELGCAKELSNKGHGTSKFWFLCLAYPGRHFPAKIMDGEAGLADGGSDLAFRKRQESLHRDSAGRFEVLAPKTVCFSKGISSHCAVCLHLQHHEFFISTLVCVSLVYSVTQKSSGYSLR